MVGKNISHFQILRKIGSGGMGDVFLAEDTRLNRTVAVKILSSSYTDDPEYRRRFLREAKAASLLDHPHIAHVYEIGEHEGTIFMVMQFIEGQTLQHKINGKAMEEAEIVDLGIQIASALQEAHSKGIVHRDLKPSNVLITNRGQAKVLDFGLAKASANGPATRHSLDRVTGTNDGKILGTVPYMSPEQALGEKVDQRSDLFSLGLIFYEMATGHPAFSAENSAGTLYKIVHEQPESIAKANHSISIELERIIRKCLQKEIDRRYQSAKDLTVDLRNLLRNRTTVATKPVPRTFDLRWQPIFYATAVLLILISAYLLFPGKKAGIQSIAVLPFLTTGITDAEYLGDGMADSIIVQLSRIPELRVMARSTVSPYKGQQVDPRKVGRDLDVDAVLTGTLTQINNVMTLSTELVNVEDGAVLWGETYQRNAPDFQRQQEEIASTISRQLSARISRK